MSGTTDSMLDAIDGALRDSVVSKDAMRWVPEGGRTARPERAPGSGPWFDLSGATIVLNRTLSTPPAGNLPAWTPFRSPPVFAGAITGELFPGAAARLAALVPAPAPASATDLRQALADFGRIVADAFRPLFDYLARMAHGIHRMLFPSRHRRCWTCHPERKPKPLAVNGNEYQRRQRARRRRRR